MQSFKINGSLFVTLLLWASAFVGIRIGLTAYSPGSLALLRLLVASFCMALVYARLSNRQPIPWMVRFQLLLLGAAGFGVYNLCLNYGELTVSAGVASFVIGLVPVLTILLSVYFLKERPPLKVYVSILISFSGLCLLLVAGCDDAPIYSGIFIIFISAWMGAIYCLVQQRFLQRYHPVPVTAWVIWGGTLSLMIFAPSLWREIGGANASATWAAIYLGAFPAALAYLLWSYVLRAMSASDASMYLYTEPLLSTVLGFLVLHEQPSGLSLFGGLLAMAGALCAARYRLPLARGR